MTELPIVNSSVKAIVDDDAFPLASYWSWGLSNDGHVKHSHYGGVLLHVLLYGKAPVGFDWDHKNRNPLDNRRENLRICTRSQNKANADKHRDGKAPFKGICFDKSRRMWISKICVNRKQINLGRFHSAREAALAYDSAARKFFGEFANPNFKEE